MIGAVSPATRAIPRIEEVKIPGNAYGKTFFRMVCHLVAPSASEPSRNPCGTARNDSSLAVMMAGKTIKPSVNQPEPEKPEHDRWHSGQVENRDTNQSNETAIAAVLTQINCAADANEKRQRHRTDHE